MSSSWVIFSWHLIFWLCIVFLVLPKILNPLYAVALCTEWGNLHLHYFWCNWDDTWPFINSYLSSILQFERKQNLEIIVNACTTTTKQGQGRIYTSVSGLTHILHLTSASDYILLHNSPDHFLICVLVSDATRQLHCCSVNGRSRVCVKKLFF